MHLKKRRWEPQLEQQQQPWLGQLLVRPWLGMAQGPQQLEQQEPRRRVVEGERRSRMVQERRRPARPRMAQAQRTELRDGWRIQERLMRRPSLRRALELRRPGLEHLRLWQPVLELRQLVLAPLPR